MPLTVRVATPSDGLAIATVQLVTWRVTYQEWIPEAVAALDLTRTAANWARAADTVGQRVAVAERDGHVIGYAHSGPPDGDTGDLTEQELYALYVLPDAQAPALAAGWSMTPSSPGRASGWSGRWSDTGRRGGSTSCWVFVSIPGTPVRGVD